MDTVNMWFRMLSWEQWSPLLIGAVILVFLFLIKAYRNRSEDLFYELGRPPTFQECWGNSLQCLYTHCRHCLLGLFLFTCAWAYFTSCYDFWSYCCRSLGIPHLNPALIPALAAACCCFIRILRCIGSIFHSDSPD